MNKEQLYETIEAYLEGKLSEEARHAFEQEMAADPQLKTEVALHRKMHQELGRSGKAELRKQLTQIAREFPLENKGRARLSWLRPASLALAAAIIGAVIWWAWGRFSEPAWQQETVVAVDSLPAEQTADPDSLMAVRPEPKPEETLPPAQQKPPARAEQPVDPFLPNPTLEGLAAARVLDTNFLVIADIDAAQSSSESFRATVAGTLRSGALIEEGRVQLYIYDNQPDSYRTERPQASLPLELQRLDDEGVQAFGGMKNYTFEKEVEKKLPPGLYYYVIKREGEDEPLFVGKVEVKKEN